MKNGIRNPTTKNLRFFLAINNSGWSGRRITHKECLPIDACHGKAIPAEIRIQSKSAEDSLITYIASPPSISIFNRGTTALDRFSELSGISR
jgi:hypothetical protein